MIEDAANHDGWRQAGHDLRQDSKEIPVQHDRICLQRLTSRLETILYVGMSCFMT